MTYQLNSPFISSAFLPMQMKANSLTNFLKSANTPLLEKSPLFLQNTFDRRILNNSSFSNKGSTLPTKLESDAPNPMLIRFEPFTPTINKSTSGKKSLPINQNFFQMETPRKKENNFEEINTFLFNKTTDRKKEKLNVFDDPRFYIPKKISAQSRRIDIVKKNIDYYPTKKSGHKINSLNSFSNNSITNVINYDVQTPNQKSLNRKRKRSFEKKIITKPKKTKKLDKTLVELYLNQIIIKGISLQKFPLIRLPKEIQSPEILQRLITQGNYFGIDEESTLQEYSYTRERMNKTAFKTYFHKERIRNKPYLYLIESNKFQDDPYYILFNYYEEIKNTIIQIQKNYVGKKKGILNKEQCDILYKLIFSTNVLTDIILKYKPTPVKRIKVIKTLLPKIEKQPITSEQKNELYECPFCHRQFEKGQGLGGHMSRHHPKQSEKYKEKMEIRKKRAGKRKLLFEIKVNFFKLHEMNYKEMLKNGEKEKTLVFIKQHRNEYISYKKAEQKKALKKNKEVTNIN